MGIATILKLLPREGNSKAYSLQDFLREHASPVADEVDASILDGKDLPEGLSMMIIAPLSSCPVLATHEDSRNEIEKNDDQHKKYNNHNYNHIYKQQQQQQNNQRNNMSKSRCQQSVRTIVDDVVYSLVQTREKLRCKRQHERRHAFRRKRKSHTIGETKSDTVLSGTNALIHGFGVPREGDTSPPRGMKFGVTYQRPNENVSFCKSSPIIKRLHELVGDEVLRMILMHTRCFLPIIKETNQDKERLKQRNHSSKQKRKRDDGKTATNNNNNNNNGDSHNYILLCGPPLIFDSTRASTKTTPRNDKNRISKTKKKRKRSFPTSLAEASPLRANQSLSRFSLMYCDFYVPRVGLPKSHSFPQRLERQKQMKDNQKQGIDSPPQHCKMNDFNFLLNVIFELHLDNKNKQRRIRKRLKEKGRMVCERLWKNYSSCHDYGRSLTKYCPLPQVYIGWKAAAAPNAGNKDQCLAELAHTYTHKEGIVSFVSAVLRRVFPNEFWGSESNFSSFLASVRSFVHLRRQEKLANKNIMHGISVTSMKWLYPTCTNDNNGRKKRKHGNQRTNHEAATELTLQALRWVFNGFVIPLLRSCFYVTETEFAARELHYYRKPVWALFRALSLQKITTTSASGIAVNANQSQVDRNHFRILSNFEALECLRNQKMGVSRLRFLPKATGMRPIAQLSRSARFVFPHTTPLEKENDNNLKRSRIENRQPQDSRPAKKQKIDDSVLADTLATKNTVPLDTSMSSTPHVSFSRLPTNVILENVLDVLTYECDQRERVYGNGLGNLHQFYVRYRDYMAGFRQRRQACNNNAKNPLKFFFAKVDIEKCYDRIHQDYLLNLVEAILSHNSYVVQTVKLNHANLRNVSSGDNAMRFKKIVEAIEDYQSFHRRDHSMSRKTQNTVFELIKCCLVDKPKIRQLLREHLLHHTVVSKGRYEPKLLLQTQGISQGSALSTLLCNLYYGRVEKLMKLDNESDLMSRFVDDFLFITPDENSFRQFLDKTHKGKPELGANINPNKTLVNVKASVKIPSNEGGTKSVNLSRSDRTMNNGRKFFPWCGFLFDTSTGEVAVDYERFRGGKLVRSLTIDADGNEGERLARRLEAFLFPRCLPILYDDSINSFPTIVANFYQMMLFGACKTREYIRGLNALMKRHPHNIQNTAFLLHRISGLSRYAIKNIRAKAMHCNVDNDDDDSGDITGSVDPRRFIRIDNAVAIALTFQAFADVFSYSSGFGSLTRLLRQNHAESSQVIPRKTNDNIRIITSRAFDDFRINTMIEK